MKKILLSLVAIAAAVFATSCTNDLLDEGVKGGNTVTFNISTPELATRAFGDGATATHLYYAVYEGNKLLNDISVTPGETPVELQGGKTSIMLDLASGIEYNLIFWAAAPEAIGTLYDVHFDTKSMSLKDPDKFVSQNENLDAFYAYVDEVVAGTDEDVELYRPFAQLNISVSNADILAAQKANLTVAETKVVVKNAYKTLNLVNGNVAEKVAYTFDFAALPTGENAAFPNADYTRYAMNYLLVKDKELVEVDFAYNRAAGEAAVNTRTFGNVPVQRNYRTNIYGDLLTKSTGFEVEIMEEWTEPAYGGAWDGIALEEPAIDAKGNVLVFNGAQLAYVATAINGGDLSSATTRAAAIDYSKKTILLTNDIDLGDKAWTPIGLNADDAKKFSGTFDGQGYTISNLNVNTPAGYTAAGLFGALNGTAKNFTIKNATIEHLSSGAATDNGIAVVAGSIYLKGTIENVKVKGATVKGNRYVGGISGYTYGNVVNCSVEDIEIIAATDNLKGSYDNGDKVGGIAGYYSGERIYKFSGNSVKNATITAYRDFGGVVGTANAAVVENCSIENVTLIIDNSQNYKGYTSLDKYNVGSIVGRFTGSTTEKNNSGEATIVANTLDISGAAMMIPAETTFELTKEIAKNISDGATIIGGEGAIIKLANPNISADNVTIKNVTFQKTDDTQKTAVITLTGNNPTLEDCVFTGASGNGFGVVVCGTDSNNVITLKNCDFSQDDFFKPIFDNWSGLKGGTLVIDGCKMKNGLYTMHIDGGGQGGYVVVKNSDLFGFTTNGASLDNLTFENCVMGETAGYACFNLYTSHTFINCTFPTKADAKNVSNYGLYVTSTAKGDTMIMKNCKMSDGTPITWENIAVADGGFLNWDSDSVACTWWLNDELLLKDGNYAAIELGEGTTNAIVAGTVTSAGITVPEGATMNLKGTTGAKLTVENAEGSAIGGAGVINIENLANLTAKGNGDHAFGIGGNGATVNIKNTTIDYVCGGHIQPLFVNDTKYGKSEPEGGAAIGGAKVRIEGSTITKAEGGSKAAAIGAQYWQNTEIEIINSTLVDIFGGNASAAIGGSRYGNTDKYDVKIRIDRSTITNAVGGQAGAGIGAGYDTHCNGQDYTAVNDIVITKSNITAKGGKYAAGIGTGFHSAYLSGSIDAESTINATCGENFYKTEYTKAQNIGYGIVDPAREYQGDNAVINFTVAGAAIAAPAVGE